MKDKITGIASLAGLTMINSAWIVFDEWAGRISLLMGIVSAILIARYWWYKGNQIKQENEEKNQHSDSSS